MQIKMQIKMQLNNINNENNVLQKLQVISEQLHVFNLKNKCSKTINRKLSKGAHGKVSKIDFEKT